MSEPGAQPLEDAQRAVISDDSAPNMGWIRLTFPQEGFSIDVTSPDVETNPIFRAAATHYLKPVELAARLGRISQERNEELTAKCYASGVIIGSITPELQQYNEAQWASWLLEDLDRFRIIREYCEAKINFGGADDAD